MSFYVRLECQNGSLDDRYTESMARLELRLEIEIEIGDWDWITFQMQQAVPME